MITQVPSVHLDIIVRKSGIAAARLVRCFHTPVADIDDIQQDLIADLLPRLPKFDPERGEFGAFVHTIIRNEAARLAARKRRDTLLVQTSLDDCIGPNGASLADITGDPGATLAFASAEQRMVLEHAQRLLLPDDIAMLGKLLDRSAGELACAGKQSRAGIYRRRREIQLRLMLAGVAV